MRLACELFYSTCFPLSQDPFRWRYFNSIEVQFLMTLVQGCSSFLFSDLLQLDSSKTVDASLRTPPLLHLVFQPLLFQPKLFRLGQIALDTLHMFMVILLMDRILGSIASLFRPRYLSLEVNAQRGINGLRPDGTLSHKVPDRYTDCRTLSNIFSQLPWSLV